jgi:predicted Asp-tRNA(Asn)/Glu-tRNA(Gln) amidotransferase subunit C
MEQKEIEKLQEETKKLLDKFSKALEKVKSSGEWNVERDSDRRKEGEGKICDETFRKIMLENAPQKDEDFIIAEKKTW